MKILFNILKYLFVSLVVSTAVIFLVGALVFIAFEHDLPHLISIDDYRPRVVTTVLGRGDVPIGEYFEERRYLTPIDEIPEMVQKAFVSAEDDRFFEHQGIDLQGILRAAIANLKAGRVVQGGSTITQQVAKSLLLTPEKSFFRKIKEAILANRMEKNLGKKQILHLYLNQIYLGNGAYGVEAASRVYFRKSVKEISVQEAAILAGLPQAPSKYSPLSNPKSAKQRQLYVLRRMAEDGVISHADAEKAGKENVRIYYPKDLNSEFAPYYNEYVRKYVLEKYGKENLYENGLIIKTPADANLCKVAMKAIKEGLRNVDKKQGYRGALRKNRTPQEVEEALADANEYNITKKYPFVLMLETGVHSKNISERISGVKTEWDAFDEGEIFKAVVTRVDDAKKEVEVSLGLVKGIISIDSMRWAAPVKSPSSTGVEPISRPSAALSKGDLILARLISKVGKNGVAVLSLEQDPLVQGALLSMEVKTGEVLAMVGGYDFKESEFNRAVQAERQPGSTFKPIIYSAAVDKGYTAATIIQDSPIVFDAGDNQKWKPENYEEKFYGDTTFRSALVRSRNIPTIKIVQDIEVPYLIDYAKRLGFGDRFSPDLSIALGSTTASLLDLTKTYGVFARGGNKVKAIFVSKVTDREGKVLEETQPSIPKDSSNFQGNTPAKPVLVAGELQLDKNAGKADPNRGVWNGDAGNPDLVLDPKTAYVMTHLMNEVATMGTGSEAKALGRPAAGKTGTTNDYLDAWFMGFTAQVVTGVWVGFDQQRTIAPKATGAMIALPVWLDFMKEAVKPYPIEEFAVPKGITFTYIDGNNGRLSVAGRPNSFREAFVQGMEPTATSGNGVSLQVPMSAPQRGGSQPGNSGPADDFFKEDIE